MLGKRLVGLAFIALTSFGCQANKDAIAIYTVPKESESLPAVSVKTDHPIFWKLPAGWKEIVATDMRLGSFRIQHYEAKQLDASVVMLSGTGGGLLSNVNRWRGQLQLKPISEGELNQYVQTLAMTDKTVQLVTLVSENTSKQTLAAVWQAGDRTFFFKLTGDAEKVASEKTHFLTWLKGVRLETH